jgi:integrase
VRPHKTQVRREQRSDGGITYSLRPTIPRHIALGPGQGRRPTLCLGRDTDGWTKERASAWARRVDAALAQGIWPLPELAADTTTERSIIECGRDMIARHPEWDADTRNDAEWRLSLLDPFWSDVTPGQATALLVENYRAAMVREANRLKAAVAAERPERDARNRIKRGLARSSINKALAMLARTLDDARKLYHWGPGGHIARGRDVRLPTEKPRRKSLEADETRLFLQAARHIDRWPVLNAAATAAEVVLLRDDQRLPWREIATSVGKAMSTVHYLYHRAKAPESIGRHEALALALVSSAIRASEAAMMTLEDLTERAATMAVRGTKTAAADRRVDMTHRVAERLGQYVRSRAGKPERVAAFPTSSGAFRDRHSVYKFVQSVAKRARYLAAEQGRHFPRHFSTHDLRRTSAALRLACGFDLAYIIDQIGHDDDGRLVLEVYNEVQKRMDRSKYEAAFDEALFGDDDGV